MKYRNKAALFAAAFLATGVGCAWAEDEPKITRSADGWMVKSEGSEFTENRNIIALKIDRDVTTGIALRCSDHKKSVTLRHYDATYEPGKSYAMQVRVAKGEIQSYTTTAINNRTLQVSGGEKLVDGIMGAKKFAIKLQTGADLFEELVYESKDMRGALKAYLEECPVK